MVLLISNIAAWNAACKKYKIVTSLPGQFPVMISFTKPGPDPDDIDYEPNATSVCVMYPMHACKLLAACSQQHLGAAVDGITLVKAAAALKPWHQGLGGIGMQNVQKAPAGVSGVPAYVLENEENGMKSTITSNKEYIVGDVVLVDGVEWTVTEVTKVLSDGVTQVKEDSDLNIMPDKPGIPGMEEIPMDPTLLDQATTKIAEVGDQGHVLDVERDV
jgi:hypothetical protein